MRQIRLTFTDPQIRIGASLSIAHVTVALIAHFAVPASLATRLRLVADPWFRRETAEIVSKLSTFCLLEPGDVIACGTFAGTGWPAGRFLRPGDIVRIEIDGIGHLANRVIAYRAADLVDAQHRRSHAGLA